VDILFVYQGKRGVREATRFADLLVQQLGACLRITYH